MFLFGKKQVQESHSGPPGSAPPASDDRKKEEESINSFMSILKKQHSDGMISEETFRETLAKNEEELKRIKKGAAPANAARDTDEKGNVARTQEIKREYNGGAPENYDGENTANSGHIREVAAAEKNAKNAKISAKSGKGSGAESGRKKSPGGNDSFRESDFDSDEGAKPKKKDSLKNNDKGRKEKGESDAVPQEQKTVGEILRDEGVIRDDENRGKAKIEQEVDLNQMLMSIEKLTAEVEALRDIKFQSDERIKEISESIGEMRSLIFQRDGAIKEMQMKLEKMDDSIADIKPDKIAGEMRKREQESMEEGAKIEKLERMDEDIARQMRAMQKILENVKSMENLVSVSREIEEKLSRIEELKTGTERDAEKSEKMYLEMDRRMQDLMQVKESVRKLDELTKELVKIIDEEKIKMAGFVGKEDLQKALEAALKPPSAGKTQEDKASEKQEIESLLKNIEMQYKKGLISKESFYEVSEKNKGVLQMLDKEIKEYDASKNPQTLIEWMSNMESKLNEMQVKFSFVEESVINGQRAKQQQSQQSAGPPAQKNYLQPSFPIRLQRRMQQTINALPPIEIEEEGNGSGEGESRLNKPAGSSSEIEGIKELIAEIEDQYREGLISDRAYDEMMRKNRKRLAESGAEEDAQQDRIEILPE